ncbi:MAG: hypothetical protein K0Q84_809, partial [Arthrobacter sp.]|nr:hypothetical protein [Arthrobacter sp.]
APALLTDAGEVAPSSPEADVAPGTAIEADPTVSQVKATVDGSLSLEAWAGRILDDEDDDESSASPEPTVSPTQPSFSPSSTPVPTVPVPTLPATPLPTTSPAPAPAPTPTSTTASGPTPTSPTQTSPSRTSPSQTSAPAPAGSRPGYSPAASVPAPATQQAPAAQSGANQLPAAGEPAPAAQPAQAPAGAPAPAAGSAAGAPDRSAKGKLDTATSRPGAAGITSGVWGAGRLSSPMNMGTVDSRYSVSGPNSAVLGSAQAAQAGPVSPLVWAGAGLVLLAGAAGLVAYKLRRAL